MTENEGVDLFIQQAEKFFYIAEVKYRYTFVNQVADLLRQGFESSGLEYDIISFESLMERGSIRGIQPGRGIISGPDRIQPKVQARMDGAYGVGNWEFVEITNDSGSSIFKPLIKSRES